MKKKNDVPGTAFVGFILLGLAFGLYFGRPDVGILGGVGLGFIAMAILMTKYK